MSAASGTDFNQYIQSNELQAYLKAQKLQRPTQIQSLAFQKVFTPGNYIIHGKTGSGKTLSFLLPVFTQLKNNEQDGSLHKKASPRAIILAPTRELCLQLFSVAKEVSHFSKLRVRKLVGGDKGKSLSSILNSSFDILVTTPERCLRSLKQEEILLDQLEFCVFDEADQLIENSFQSSVKPIAEFLEKINKQTYLISASKPENFDEIVQEYFPKTKFETVGKGEENVLNHQVQTINMNLEDDEKFIFVKGLVKKQNKRNGLIFTGNKSRAQKVYQVLKDDQHKKLFLIHKDLEIKERKKMLDDFKKSGGVIIATDIMARGVDISHLQWVLNFDIPSAPDYYLHRCGRVGRAGRAGDVFNFVTSKDALRQKNINIALMQQGRTDLKIPSTVIKKKKKAPIKKKTEKKRRVKQTKRTLKYGR